MDCAALRTQCPLFAGIAADEFTALLDCLAPVRRSYRGGEHIYRVGDRDIAVGIVLSGSVRVVHEDFWGRRMILTHIPAGDLFAEAFACAGAGSMPFDVVTCGSTEVLLADYDRIMSRCSSACAFHGRMTANMVRILAQKSVLLAAKMQYLSCRSTRDKLLAFLTSQRDPKQKDKTVEIPFNRQELADYLCVDRSALSRELGLMRKEGLLLFNKNRFTVLG